MTAIVAGQGLGLLNTSWGLLGGQGQLGVAGQGATGDKVLVNAATGNLVVQQQDEWLVGVGPDVAVSRTYNSLGAGADDNGDNWRLGLNRVINGLTGTINTVGSTITRVGEDSSETVYTHDGSQYVSKSGSGSFDTLTYNADVWTWTDGDTQTQELYNVVSGFNARLTSVIDLDSNKINLTYLNATSYLITEIATFSGSTASNEKVVITYDTTSGKTSNILSMTTTYKDALGATQSLNRVSYTYETYNTSFSRLKTVTVDLKPVYTGSTTTHVTTYGYIDATSKRLASITQSDGSKVIFGYDTSGRIQSFTQVAFGQSQLTTFDYSVSGKTTITDPLLQNTELSYGTAAGQNQYQLTQVKTPAVGGTSQTTNFDYDANGNVLHVTDGRGSITTYEYDTNGNRTYERDATGHVVERTYSATNLLLQETTYTVVDPDGDLAGLPSGAQTTSYAYNSTGHLRFVISPQKRVTEYKYNTLGQQTSMTLYGAAPLGSEAITDTALSAWTAQQDLTRTQRTDYTYNSRSQLDKATTYATISSAGVGASPAVTQYVYDQAGNLLTRIDGLNHSTSYTYDGLNRVVRETDALGQQKLTVYNEFMGLGYVAATIEVNGQATVNSYDAHGRLFAVQRISDVASTIDYGTIGYSYDKLNRLRMVTSATGEKTFYIYDEASRKVGQIDQSGALTQFIYNADNQLVQTKQWANPVSANVLSALASAPDVGSLSATIGLDVRPIADAANDRINVNVYDLAGRLVKTIDAAGAVVTHTYDGAGQLVQTIRHNNVLNATKLAAVRTAGTEVLADDANTVPTTSINDRYENRYYSADGLLDGVLDGVGAYTENTYDAAGRLIKTVKYANLFANASGDTPDASVKPQAYDQPPTSGDYVLRDPANDQVTHYLYNARGQLTGVLDAESYYTRFAYDAAGNKTLTYRYTNKVQGSFDGRTAPAFIGSSAAAPATGSYIYTNPEHDHIVNSFYDELNRVYWMWSRPEYAYTYYDYDTAGNLVSVKTEYVLESAKQSRYDKLGRLTATLPAEGSQALLDWVRAGVYLPAEIAAQTEVIWATWGTHYTYDNDNRLTSATEPDGFGGPGLKTLYYYDAAGRKTVSVNALGEVTQYTYSTFGQLTTQTQVGKRLDSATLDALKSAGGGRDTAVASAVADLVAASTGTTSTHRWGYDQRGLVSSVTDALNNASTRSYNAFGQLFQSVDKVDASRTRTTTNIYDTNGRRVRVSQSGTGMAGRNVEWVELDSFGRVAYSYDPTYSSSTEYRHDRLGRQVQMYDRLGALSATTYDAFDRVVTTADALGKVTNYSYDSANLAQTITTPEGISTVTVRDNHGQIISVTDGRGTTTTYTYDHDNHLTATTVTASGAATPLISTSAVYDQAGRVFETTDARGTITRTTYDAANRVLTRVVDPDGTGLKLTSEYRYDAKGQAVWAKDANGVWTKSEFNLKGELTATVVDPLLIPNPAGSTTDFDDLVANTTGLNLRTEYTYDAQSHVLTVTEGALTAQAKLTQYIYDPAGRRTSEIVDPGTGKLNLTTSYTYDRKDNVVSRTDAEGNVTRYAYDDENRLLYTVDPTGAVTGTEYDANGRVSRTTAYANRIVLSAAQALLMSPYSIYSLISRDAGKDQVTRYTRDQDGRLIDSIDALGFVTRRTYDQAGSVTKLTRYAQAASTVLQTASGTGAIHFTSPAMDDLDANNQVEQTVYDAAGRAIWSIDALGYATQRTFDANGNALRTTRYSAPLVFINSTQNWLNQNRAPIVGISFVTGDSTIAANTEHDQTTYSIYDAANRTTFEVDAQGYVTQTAYDNLGRIYGVMRYAAPVDYDFAIGGDPQLSPDDQDAPTIYLRDSAGRVTDIINAEQIVTHHTYNAAGLLTDVTTAFNAGPQASTTHYEHDAAGRVIEETRAYGNPEQSTTRYVLDALGQHLKTIHPRGVAAAQEVTDPAQQQARLDAYTTTQEFDALGRIIKSTDALGHSINSQFDAFGNAVMVTDPNGNTGFFYFDQRNQATLHVDPLGDATETRYDGLGQVVSITKYANATQGLPTPGTVPSFFDTAQEAATSGSSFYLVKDEENDATTWIEHDQLGRQILLTDAEGYSEAISYDGLGNKVSFTNKLSGTYLYTHDRLGRVITETSPEQSGAQDVVTRFFYDARGNVVQKIEAELLPEQRVTTYFYDLLNRQTEQRGEATLLFDTKTGIHAYWEPSDRRLYDTRGNVVEAIDPNGVRTLNYWDAQDRKIADIKAGTLTTYEYDAGGNLTRRVVHAQQLPLPEQAGGSPPSALLNRGHQETRYTYDANHRLATTTVTGLPSNSLLNDATANVSQDSWMITGLLDGQLDNTQLNQVFHDDDQAILGGRTLELIQQDDNPGRSLQAGSGKIDVRAGSSYQASVQMATHQSTATLQIIWWNQNGVEIGRSSSQPLTSPDGQYAAIGIDAIAPANAVRASLVIVKNATLSGHASSSVTFGQPYFAQAQPAGIYVGAVNTTTGNYEIRLLELVTSRQYDASGNLAKETDANGNVTWRFYDKLGKQIAQLDADRYLTTWTRDGNGNILEEKRFEKPLPPSVPVTLDSSPASFATLVSAQGGARTTTNSYDKLGRLRQQTVHDVLSSTVDTGTGQVTTTTSDAVTQYRHNGLGMVTWQKAATGEELDWHHDQLGRETRKLGATFIDHEGDTVRQTTGTEYNGLGLTRRTIELGKDDESSGDDSITEYAYDQNGWLISSTTAMSETQAAVVRYQYDAAGRVTVKSTPRHNSNGWSYTDVIFYTYDEAGHQTKQQSVTFAGMVPDVQSLPATGSVIQTQEARYDAYGQIVAKRTYGDALPTLYTAEHRGAWQEWFEYDAAGRMVKTNGQSGVERAYFYDGNGNSTLLVEPGTVVANFNGNSNEVERDWSIQGLLKDMAGTYQTISTYDGRNHLKGSYRPIQTPARDALSPPPLTIKAPGNAANHIITVGSISGGVNNLGWAGTNDGGSSTSVVSGTAVLSGVRPIEVLTSVSPEYMPRLGQPASGGDVQLSVGWPETYLGAGSYSVKVTYSVYQANHSVLWGSSDPAEDEPTVGQHYENITDEYVVQNGELSATFTRGKLDHPYGWAYFYNATVEVYKNAPTGRVLIGTVVTDPTLVKGHTQSSDDDDPGTGSMLFIDHYSGAASQGEAVSDEHRIHIKGQEGDTAHVFVNYRNTATQGAPWSSVVLGAGQKLGQGWFAMDYSALASGTYELRYISLDANGHVLNDQSGNLRIDGSNSYFQQWNRLSAPKVTYFTDDQGFVNIPSQDLAANSAVLSYLNEQTGSWSSTVLSTGSSIHGLSLPGWLRFQPTGPGVSFLIEYKANADGSGASLGKMFGTVDSLGDARLQDYADLPYSIHWQNLPLDTSQAVLKYKPQSGNIWTSVNLSQDSPGTFTLDTLQLLLDIFMSGSTEQTLDLQLDCHDQTGRLVASNASQLLFNLGSVQVIPGVLTPLPPEHLTLHPPFAAATTLHIHYRTVGATSYTSATVDKGSHGLFTIDLSELIPEGGSTQVEYYYEAYDGAILLSTPDAGAPASVPSSLQPGSFALTSTLTTEADAILLGVANPKQVSHRSQKVNAFGEVVEQTNALGHVTTLSYNTMGKLVEKLEAETNVTLEDGQTVKQRPSTRYGYDLQGRLVTTEDANHNRTSQVLKAGGSGEEVVLKEFHADHATKVYGYDVLGNQRRVDNELGFRTTFEYDKMHHVTKVLRPMRDDGKQGWDEYDYDEVGNRLAHRTTATGSDVVSERTDYDALARVVNSWSGAGHLTSMAYEEGILSGGLSPWGTRTTTTDANGRRLIDEMDAFGRVSKHTYLNGNQRYYRYDLGGRLILESHTTEWYFLRYTYYGDGQLQSIMDRDNGNSSVYEYDAEGNKTFEGYVRNSDATFYQMAEIRYDELNRMTSIKDAQYELSYQYDAVGNRRHVSSQVYGGLANDYWYKYDSMNRFVVTMGQLSGVAGAAGTTITKGSSGDGLAIQYDAAGQRAQVDTARDGHSEKYSYTAEGYLQDVTIQYAGGSGYTLASSRTSDLMGRVTHYVEGSTVRDFLYNLDNKVWQDTTNGKTTTYNLMADGTVNYSVLVDGATTVTTYYEYEWWEAARQSEIRIQASNSSVRGWAPGASHFVYDSRGTLVEAVDEMATGGPRRLRYVTNAQGLILMRDELGAGGSINKTQTYFYVNGQRVGEAGNDPGTTSIDYAQALAQGSNRSYSSWRPQANADFDQNYLAINASYPGFTSSGYTVKSSSETLQSVALAVFGDSSLWYLIAEANGMSNSTDLVENQNLVIPNKVANVHNNNLTHKVYNASEAMGDTSPTLPDAPPPPKPKKGCGVLGTIIMVVVAVVASVVTAGAALSVIAPGLTAATASVGSVMAAGAIGGAVGSVASQLVGMTIGAVDKFSWSSVAQGAIGGAIGGAVNGIGNASGPLSETLSISGGGMGNAILRGITANVLTQGASMAVGLQKKFSWTSVASAAANAAGSMAGGWLANKLGDDLLGGTAGLVARQTLQGVAGGWAGSMARHEKADWGSIAINAFGSALGDSLAGSIASNDRDQPKTAKIHSYRTSDVGESFNFMPLKSGEGVFNIPDIDFDMPFGASEDPGVDQNIADLSHALYPKTGIEDAYQLVAGPAEGVFRDNIRDGNLFIRDSKFDTKLEKFGENYGWFEKAVGKIAGYFDDNSSDGAWAKVRDWEVRNPENPKEFIRLGDIDSDAHRGEMSALKNFMMQVPADVDFNEKNMASMVNGFRGYFDKHIRDQINASSSGLTGGIPFYGAGADPSLKGLIELGVDAYSAVFDDSPKLAYLTNEMMNKSGIRAQLDGKASGPQIFDRKLYETAYGKPSGGWDKYPAWEIKPPKK
ncbi:MAG: hypothetical protein Q7V20_17725 [Aquabacterium sp.]|uniref:hypothetical protein n=1 Tax=Aquabacterium sp. TaxID=1872578 RepID=UPI0027290B5E|nr:hypothetical protein [Aquabacterium sp.]MDO9005289.1 hypothetical protein [Aquabacterium sp.]